MSRGGRGGKSSSSLTQEQMQSLGIGPGMSKEMPSIAVPPPTFPPLMSKPIPFEISTAENYMILWKEDFLNYMRDSPYYLLPKTKIEDGERFLDQCNQTLDKTREKRKLDIPTEYLPYELWATNKKKRVKKIVKEKKEKYSVEKRLELLEQKEKTDDKEVKDKNSDSEDDEQEGQEIEIEDDEMDDEIDYGNNYFDNGEAFNEEDDNLDDGPVF